MTGFNKNPVGGKPARSMLESALEKYEEMQSSMQLQEDDDDDDSELCIISLPADMSLDLLNGITVIEDAVQDINVGTGSSKKRPCQIQHGQTSKEKFAKRVFIQSKEDDPEASGESMITHTATSVIKIHDRETVTAVNFSNCIPRPIPPAIPQGLKERFKPFGWKEPQTCSPAEDTCVKKKSHKRKKSPSKKLKVDSDVFVKLERLSDSEVSKSKKKKRKSALIADESLFPNSPKTIKCQSLDLSERMNVQSKKKKKKKTKS